MDIHLNKREIGLVLLLAITLFVITIVLFADPIAQDQQYHQFHDTQIIFGIPNFWNVISNIVFLFVGLRGVKWMTKVNTSSYLSELKLVYWVLFVSLTCIGIGSSYYHLSPNNNTLVWDRLPMTVAFMSLFSIIIAEFISIKLGRKLFVPLLITGTLSVVYWQYTEQLGQGDLRLYVLVQFLPVLLIPVILLMFESVFTHKRAYWLMIGAYGAAKLLEYFDSEVAEIISISGHTLKHLVAGLGIYLLVSAYNKRLSQTSNIDRAL